MNPLFSILLGFSILGLFFGSSQEPIQGVDYPNPQTPYEIAVSELNNYVPVYECNITQDMPGKKVMGRTYFKGTGANRTPKYVDIQTKRAFVVYHEEGHVLNPDWNESQCNDYAVQKDNSSLYEQGYSFAVVHCDELEGHALGEFAPEGLSENQREEYCNGMMDFLEDTN